MNEEFLKELKRYDINFRTAESLYDLFEKNPNFLEVSNEEILYAYCYWYEEYWKICEVNRDNILKIIEVVKSIFEDGKRVPVGTIITSPWEDTDIELYTRKKSVSIKVNKCATYQKLFDLWKQCNEKTIKIGFDGPICPSCESTMYRNGGCFLCRDCNASVHVSELIKRGRLMTKGELKKAEDIFLKDNEDEH